MKITEPEFGEDPVLNSDWSWLCKARQRGLTGSRISCDLVFLPPFSSRFYPLEIDRAMRDGRVWVPLRGEQIERRSQWASGPVSTLR